MSTAFIASNIDHIPKRLICLDLLILTHTDAYQNIWDDTELSWFLAYQNLTHTDAYQNIWDDTELMGFKRVQHSLR